MNIDFASQLAEVSAQEWDALVGEDDPFVEHAFLLALENSGSVGRGTGWQPMHVLARDGGRLVAALPLYVKQHSYGEYVFDFGWAQAALRAGIRYYPKLVAMVPFTPATGRRFLIAPGVDEATAVRALLDGAMRALEKTRSSTIHLHFMNPHEAELVRADGRFLPRSSTQFHWKNQGYATFDDHLATFRSVVRKEVKKERRRVAEAGIEVEAIEGSQLTAEHWSALSGFYFDTCNAHGSGPYLTPEFFDVISKTHAQRVIAMIARHEGRIVAGTLNFEKGRHLYGRYWGSVERHDSLHFELCYHRLIERAIARGCSRFEAGAQGMHKLRRGLLPTEIHNACYVADPRLRAAVADFLEREAENVQYELAELKHHGPSHRVE
jgi:predicted N-acyltransferase